MNIFTGLVLGVVQGLTEFLPVSSSGHLVLVQSIVPSFAQPGVLFDVVLHLGTLFAILVYFRKKILRLKKDYIILILIGSVPAFVIGYFFKDSLELLFLSTKVVGLALITTGFMNLFTDRFETKFAKVSKVASFTIGIAQAFAIIPGISRSGSTIFAGVAQKIDRKKAAEFSFILSIPAVLGANVLQFLSYSSETIGSFSFYFVGFIAAFISGFVAINILFKFLTKRNFKLFGFYCLIIGCLAFFTGA
jgi:undecaprenyl-diphosphatase